MGFNSGFKVLTYVSTEGLPAACNIVCLTFTFLLLMSSYSRMGLLTLWTPHSTHTANLTYVSTQGLPAACNIEHRKCLDAKLDF